jgi:hypothetical protein
MTLVVNVAGFYGRQAIATDHLDRSPVGIQPDGAKLILPANG